MGPRAFLRAKATTRASGGAPPGGGVRVRAARALGGPAGTGTGPVTVVPVARLRDRTPFPHTGTVVAAPLIGLVTGVVAGIHPARRAARIQPVEALRR
ncbi:hypothetical protein ACH4A8_28255 [Streptomyces vietnamensis]|uniref:hypothetical protein n=1 Tax=Streptomyces vietnamensis TaxID=362257 RepID=UPI0037A3A110